MKEGRASGSVLFFDCHTGHDISCSSLFLEGAKCNEEVQAGLAPLQVGGEPWTPSKPSDG